MASNRALWIIVPLFILLSLLDYGTAALNGSAMLASIETNPLYLLGHSFLPLFLLSLLTILALAWLYKRIRPFGRYFVISYLLWHSLIRITAIRSNITAWLHPPTPEQIASITTQVKTDFYLSLVLSIFLPFAISILTYLIFRMDHNVTLK